MECGPQGEEQTQLRCLISNPKPDCRGCAHTGSGSSEWFSLELLEARTVTKVQIARRMEAPWEQGQNIKITIGNSQKYVSTEPECLPVIPDLTKTAGLQDYVCTGVHSGKYVKISRPGALVLCEVKVFTTMNGAPLPGKSSN